MTPSGRLFALSWVAAILAMSCMVMASCNARGVVSRPHAATGADGGGSDCDPNVKSCYCGKAGASACDDPRCADDYVFYELLHSNYVVACTAGFGEHQGLGIRIEDQLVDNRFTAPAGQQWDGSGGDGTSLVSPPGGQRCGTQGEGGIRYLFNHGRTVNSSSAWNNLSNAPGYQASMPGGATFRFAALHYEKYDNFELTKPDPGDPGPFNDPTIDLTSVSCNATLDYKYGCTEKNKKANMATCYGADVIPDGYCDHQCANDGYTLPSESLDGLFTAACGDPNLGNWKYSCKGYFTTSPPTPGTRTKIHTNPVCPSLAQFYAPTAGHNSNNDANADVAAFNACKPSGTRRLGAMDIMTMSAGGICAGSCGGDLACTSSSNIATRQMSGCGGCMGLSSAMQGDQPSGPQPSANCWRNDGCVACGPNFSVGRNVNGM